MRSFIILMFVLILSSKCSPVDEIQVYTPTEAKLTADEYEFYSIINGYNSNNLILDGRASELAKEHSKYWFEKGHGAGFHYGFSDRVNVLMSFNAENVGEVYINGFKTLEFSFIKLTESSSHDRTMLRDWKFVGVGIVDRHITVIYFK